MKTEDLVRALAADHVAQARPLEWTLAAAVATGFLLAAALFVLTFGPRDDLAEVLVDPRLVFKLGLMLLLAASSAMLALRLARPAAGATTWSLALATVPLLLFIAVIVELILLPRASWMEELIGSNSLLCLVSIPLLAAPVLVAALAVLRGGAPLRPGLTGAVAGLFAGGLGATLYATHCIDDSPLFVATWYNLAIGMVAVVGALAGRKLLRW
jgi:hypothetical protein